MAGPILKVSEIKLALKKEELNFKIQNSKLNGTEDSITFIDGCSKAKIHGKIVRSFNEGEVHHWPLLSHENIARLIDILRVRDDLYIYLTVNHEVTLKHIVHEENFLYDPRCFDRKRSYAKGIFSGLSYLHGKSLTLMNLCDDNIIISRMDDRAILTNFDHLIISRKSTKSRLNIPDIYRAPETEKGEFDSQKAEIWASGILMLDMFLAHMVPWAIVDYKPKKVVQIVQKMSLDLLQAANAGSIVSERDLEKFQAFLKCFFKQNPLERIPAKYAYITSFLQSRDQPKVSQYSYELVPFPEDILPLDYSNLNLSEKDLIICSNPTYDPPSNFISQRVEKADVASTNVTPVNSIIETKNSIQSDKNETEVDTCQTRASKSNIKLEREENFSLPSLYKSIAPATVDNIAGETQKMPKSWEIIYENANAVTDSNYNCCQSKSLSFIQPEKNDNIIASELSKKTNFGNLNDKPISAKQSNECSLQNSDLGLNTLFKRDDEIENNIDNNGANNSVDECEHGNVKIDKKVSDVFKTRNIRIETRINHRIPFMPGNNSSLQVSGKNVVKPPRYSKTPDLFLSSEVKSIMNKIIFLNKCYHSIKTHQKMFVSEEFAQKQFKFIKEYIKFLCAESSRLHNILMDEYKLKYQDIIMLTNYVYFRKPPQSENFSVSQNLYENRSNRFPQIQETENTTKDGMGNVEWSRDSKLKDTNILPMKPNRNLSYYSAVENTENDLTAKWCISAQSDNKKSYNWKRMDFSPKVKMKTKLATYALNSDKAAKNRYVNAETIRIVQPYEQKEKCLKVGGEEEYLNSANVKKANNKECNKKKEEQISSYNSGARPKVSNTKQCKNKKKIRKDRMQSRFYGQIEDDKDSKNNKQEEGINLKRKVKTNGNNPNLKTTQSNKCKKSAKTTDKEEEKLCNLKQHEPKRPWFFALCPGGRVEDTIPLVDTLCEACKLNLEFK